MPEEYTEPAREILEEAQSIDAGFTSRTLRKWHLKGIVPRPVQRAIPGRKGGSQTYYPAGTRDLVLTRLRRKRADQEVLYRAWRAWWSRGEADIPLVRRLLVQVATDFATTLRMLQTAEKPEPIDCGSWAEKRIRESWLAQMRRRATSTLFPVVVRVMRSILLGQFERFHDHHEEEVCEKALGIHYTDEWDPLRTGFSLRGTCEDAFRDISERLPSTNWIMLARNTSVLTPEYLKGKRDELKDLAKCLSELTDFVESRFGPRTYGLRAFASVLNPEKPHQQAIMLLVWIELQRWGFEENYRKLVARAREWKEQTAKHLEAIEVLKLEEPAVRSALERLGPARTPLGVSRYMRALKQVRTDHGELLDAFWIRHPELIRSRPGAEGIPRQQHE